MSNLYIIGNGFDLKHGLPSRYSDFAHFCSIWKWELFEQINVLFPRITTNSLWPNFEEGLGHVDMARLYSDFYVPYTKNIKNDKFLQLHEDLKKAFSQWIEYLKTLTENLQKRYIFHDDDCFISFNYTDTLEKTYCIKNNEQSPYGNPIFHIHNYASGDLAEGYTDYIFGHNLEVTNSRENLDSFDNQSKSFLNGLHKELKRKELKETLDKWKKDGVDGARQFDNIIILGHSMNEIDSVYYKILLKHLSSASWYIEYFDYGDLQYNLKSA